MSDKLEPCRSCDADVANTATNCPRCGADTPLADAARWWVYVLMVMAVLNALSGLIIELNSALKYGTTIFGGL